jgi:hypothetical protein
MIPPPYPPLNITISHAHSTNFTISQNSITAAHNKSLANPSAFPAFQCYAAPYGVFDIVLHLELYYYIHCLYTNSRPFRFLDIFLPQHHKINFCLCLLFSIASLILTGVAATTWPTPSLLGYFAVSGVLPLTAGTLMIAQCFRMDNERRWRRAQNANTGGAEVVNGMVLFHLVVCGFWVKDVASIAGSNWHDSLAMKGVFSGMLVLMGSELAILALYPGTVENCDRVTRGSGRGLGGKAWFRHWERPCWWFRCWWIWYLLLKLEMILGFLGCWWGKRVGSWGVRGIHGCVHAAWVLYLFPLDFEYSVGICFNSIVSIAFVSIIPFRIKETGQV